MNPYLIIAAGGVGFVTADQWPEKYRQAVKLASGGIMAWGIFTAAKSLIGAIPFSSEGKAGEAIAGIAGVAGRAVGIEEPPGIYVRPATDETLRTMNLGNPKNVLRIVGRFVEPYEGGTFKLPLFADTISTKAVIRNQGTAPIRQQVKVRIAHEGLLQSGTQQTIQEGPYVDLAPGETYEIEGNLKTVRDWDGNISLSLLFANYNLGTVSVGRKFALYLP